MGHFKELVFAEDAAQVKALVREMWQSSREKKKGPLESVRQAKILRYLEGLGGYWFKVISANRNGVPDIVGGVTVEITEEMVGQKVAVLCAFEVKDGIGKPSELQEHHIESVIEAGGIAGVVRSVECVKELLKNSS